MIQGNGNIVYTRGRHSANQYLIERGGIDPGRVHQKQQVVRDCRLDFDSCCHISFRVGLGYSVGAQLVCAEESHLVHHGTSSHQSLLQDIRPEV